ncbi:MAG: DNA repair exonuclease [Gammaproteobacteria bacterium]|nr:DNA repair exonuclease [Gammaproteobacteria bacterium]
MALTLLHTADWHLGRRFPAFEHEQEQELTRARLDAVGRILDLAESRNVDAVLCAGDLFDEPSPDESWWGGALREFTRRDWTRPVILLPGNHDPLTPNSLYDASHQFRAGLPAYVRVVDRKGWELSLGDNAVVIANPCMSRAGQTDLAASLPEREEGDDRIRIGLAHGSTFDMDGHQANFPIARGAALDRGLDYLAIGDTHAFREVEPDAAAPTVYPGAPEATNFGERDTGNVALVFFPRDRRRRAMVRPEPVGRWTWREETCTSVPALRALLTDPQLRRTVLRLVLDMEVPMAEYDEAERLIGELSGSMAASPRVGVLTVNREQFRLAADAPIEFGANLPEAVRSTVARLRARAETEPEVAGRALHHLYRLVKETEAA